MKILINGIGRIGKAILKIASKDKNIQIIAINDTNPCIENIAYSINYDSTYGSFSDKYKIKDNYIINKKNKIKVLSEKNIENIDFEALGIDYIIDSSGVKQDDKILQKLPVKKIFVSHPDKDADINIIMGVNHKELNQKHKVVSTSSCNATALLPVLKILDENYKIECGEINTIHPLLNHQKVLDGHCIKSATRDVDCNFEFGRSAFENIIPSKTTTIDACSLIMPHINSDIFSSSSLRISTQTVGVIDISIFVNEKCSKESLIKLLKKEEKKQKFNAAIDHRFTDVKMGKMIKMMIWYDNEWGYASKVVETLKYSDTI
jgi:glyceraldehyde 3-phosphate dehydrogenase